MNLFMKESPLSSYALEMTWKLMASALESGAASIFKCSLFFGMPILEH